MAGPISEITLFLTSTTAVRLPSPLWQLINCSATTSYCTSSQRPRISSVSFQGVMWVPRHFGKILHEPSLTKMASLFPHSCSRSLSICQESSVPIYFYNSSLSFLLLVFFYPYIFLIHLSVLSFTSALFVILHLLNQTWLESGVLQLDIIEPCTTHNVKTAHSLETLNAAIPTSIVLI